MMSYDKRFLLSKTAYALELWERVFRDFPQALNPVGQEQRMAVLKAVNVTEQVLDSIRRQESA